MKLTAALAAIAFFGVGGWIFYNTNILNEYLTPEERLQRQADYEKPSDATRTRLHCHTTA